MFSSYEINWNQDWLSYQQKNKYVKKILYEFVMTDCNPANVPMIGNWDFESDKSESVDETFHGSVIRKFLYVAKYTRPSEGVRRGHLVIELVYCRDIWITPR